MVTRGDLRLVGCFCVAPLLVQFLRGSRKNQNFEVGAEFRTATAIVTMTSIMRPVPGQIFKKPKQNNDDDVEYESCWNEFSDLSLM